MEQLSRFILRYRRWLAALCAGIAVWAALTALTAEPQHIDVLVAARDLPSGTELTDDDVTKVALPPGAVPGSVLTSDQLTGRMVSGAMRRGEPLTDRRVIDPRKLDHGERLVSIEASSATARLIRPGDLVDVVSVEPGAAEDARTVAESVPVVTVVESDDQGAWVVGVSADEDTSHNLSRAAVRSVLQVLPVTVS